MGQTRSQKPESATDISKDDFAALLDQAADMYQPYVTDTPKVVVVLGAPGAGKSDQKNDILAQHFGQAENVPYVDLDDLRALHPKHDAYLAEDHKENYPYADSKTADDKVHHVASAARNHVIDTLTAQKSSMVIKMAGPAPDRLIPYLKDFADKGYAVDVAAVAAPKLQNIVKTYAHAEDVIESNAAQEAKQSPQWVPEWIQRGDVYTNISESLEELESSTVSVPTGMVSVFTANGPTTDAPSATFAEESQRPLSEKEQSDLQVRATNALKKMIMRDAPAEDTAALRKALMNVHNNTALPLQSEEASFRQTEKEETAARKKIDITQAGNALDIAALKNRDKRSL